MYNMENTHLTLITETVGIVVPQYQYIELGLVFEVRHAYREQAKKIINSFREKDHLYCQI